MTLKRSDRGFTLFEFLIVMVIIVAVVGIVAPSFSGFFPAFKTQKAVEMIVAAAGKARAEAALTMRRHRLYVISTPKEDTAAYTYLAYEADPLASPGIYFKLPGAWGTPEELSDDLSFESVDGAQEDVEVGGSFFEFNTDGTATEGTIVVVHAKGERRTLKIDGTTGKVYVQ